MIINERIQQVPLRQLLASLESGSRPKGGVKGIQGGIPSIGGEHLTSDGGFNFKNVRYVPPTFASTMSRGHLKTGDVLVVKDGATTGKVSIVRSDFPYKEAVINEHVFRLEAKGDIQPPYLFYYLFSHTGQQQILSDFRGVAQGGISQGFVDKVLVPLVSIAAQKQITAEIEKQFTRLDAGIASLKHAQAELKRYRAAILKGALEGKLFSVETERQSRENGKRETGSEILKRIIAERQKEWKGRGKYKEPTATDIKKLPLLPKTWAWATLDCLAEIKGGITKDQSRKHDTHARMVPYLRVANVQRGYLDLSEVKQIIATDSEIQELSLKPGDILFNEGGDRDKLGRGWIWCGELPECIHQNHVFRARIFKDAVHPKIISWFANTYGQQFFFDKGKHTTNLASISMTKLKELPIPLPPQNEQTWIVSEVERRMSVADKLEAVIETSLQRAARLRQAILKQAFEGKLLAT